MLGMDEVLLSRVMEWCEAKDHAGVRGEANRLLAALIRHSRNLVSLSLSLTLTHTLPFKFTFTHIPGG